ncbi:MAG: PQQ-binding-like beta-propeller repeat protein [Phycisphaerae bacterium]
MIRDRGTRTTIAQARRAAATVSVLSIVALIAVLVVLWMTVGSAYLDRTRLQWVTQRGTQLLAEARSTGEIESALDRWEEETGAYWHARSADWIGSVFKEKKLDDPRVRMLVSRVTGCDYGERVDDWTRWEDARTRMSEGKEPVTPQREHVTLESRWRAPIGLTAWYSNILPLDGSVYVATLGSAFDDASDAADGIVRIVGATGETAMLWQPSDGGPRDIVGLAAGRDALFAASRNGFLYCVARDGVQQWKSPLGAAAGSSPLVLDANKDDTPDVAIVTTQGRVIVINGNGGKALWVTPLDGAGRGEAFLGAAGTSEQRAMNASLMLGDVPGYQGPSLIVTTTSGMIIALNPANGRPVWRHTLDAGIAAPPVCIPNETTGGPAVHVADARGRVYSLVRTQKDTTAIATGWLSDVRAAGVIAGVRTVLPRGSELPFVVACSVGTTAGALSVLDSTGLRWRYALPGQVRSTPAIGDVNGDGLPEMLVGSTVISPTSAVGGWLMVLSSDGHLLRREAFAAGVEAAPVISDVDGDGLLEVLVADRTGLLHCFETKRFGPIEWGLFGGDSRGTRNAANAYSWGQTPSGYQWQWRGAKR